MMAPLTIGLGNLRLHASRESSAERALELSELRYRRLFETAQDGILILDGDTGKIIDANPFLLDLLDYPFESIIGRELWEIGLFDDIDANKAAFAKLQTEEYIRYENHPLRRKGGRVVAVEFVSNVYFVGAEKVIQCNIRDITARAQFQAASNSHADTLELASKARDEANAVLFHELRNPNHQKTAGIEIDLTLQARQSRIQADAAKLEQILSNLIGNALKFTPAGGRVSVLTRDEANGELVTEVSDSGIGIPADALSRIFAPFEQGDPSIHPRYGGLGLGLSIARTLTSAQGGVLEVESDGAGQGSKFTVRLNAKLPDGEVPEKHSTLGTKQTEEPAITE